MLVLEFIADHVEWFFLFLPLVVIVWEGLMLKLLGSTRHWRKFGLGAYLGGFCLGAAGMLGAFKTGGKVAIAGAAIIILLALAMPLVALLIRETEDGKLVHDGGPKLTRIVGVFVYGFCVYLVKGLDGG